MKCGNLQVGTHVVDLGGKTVIPGLIDIHYQFFDRQHNTSARIEFT
ncbi:MAG: hypothetical protein U0Y68_23640 [Blastocatellia bacterium]